MPVRRSRLRVSEIPEELLRFDRKAHNATDGPSPVPKVARVFNLAMATVRQFPKPVDQAVQRTEQPPAAAA